VEVVADFYQLYDGESKLKIVLSVEPAWTVPFLGWNRPVLHKEPAAAALVPKFLKFLEEMTKALEHPLCLLEFERLASFNGWKLVDVDNGIKHFPITHYPESSPLDERDHDVIHEVVKIRDGIRMSGADMLKEAYEEQSIGKNHHVALGYALHSYSNTNGIFAKNSLPFLEVKLEFRNHHLIGIRNNLFAFDFTGNTKNSSKFLETKTNLNIVDYKGDRYCLVQVSNESNTFVKLNDEHGANLFVNIEETIEFDYCESLPKIGLVI
ncbi:hypothetical protein Tco_0693725, partial [Tanacetum coccineum]